jgi:hypothetical protein
LTTSEHVATHHGRADALEPSLHDRRAGIDLAALLAMHLAKGPQRKQPLVELHPADSEGVLLALLGTGNEAVQRHHHFQLELAHRRTSADPSSSVIG